MANPAYHPVTDDMIESIAIDEPVAWAGPIVMNTQDELREAFRELQNGTFVKAKMDVE